MPSILIPGRKFNMANQRQKLILFFFSGFFILIILINLGIRSTLESSKASNAAKAEEGKDQAKTREVFIEENSEYHLAPDDPAKYNIKFQGEYDIPLTEKQWEDRMRQSLRQSSLNDKHPEQLLEGVKKTPEQIDAQIADLQAKIKEYEAIALSTGDEKAKEKLQTLYMLKATLTVLKDKVTSSSPQ